MGIASHACSASNLPQCRKAMQAATVTALLNIRLCFFEDALSSSRCVVCFSVCPSLISHRPSFIADVLALFTAAFNRCLGCFESSHFDLLMRTAAHELRVTPRRAADIRARAALLVIVLEILALFIFDCVVRREKLSSARAVFGECKQAACRTTHCQK